MTQKGLWLWKHQEYQRLVLQRRGLLAQAQRGVLQGQSSPQRQAQQPWAQGWRLLGQAQQRRAQRMERNQRLRNQWLRAPQPRHPPRHP